MVSVWVWGQKSPARPNCCSDAAEITSYWHVRLSPHCLSTLRNEEKWTCMSIPFWISLKDLVGETATTCKAWGKDEVLVMFSNASTPKSWIKVTCSLAELWRENLCCTNWWLSKVLSNRIPVFTQWCSASAQRVSTSSPLFFIPDIWKSPIFHGCVYFLSAHHHNHLKSQEKITEMSSSVEQRMNQRPRARNNHGGGTRQGDQKYFLHLLVFVWRQDWPPRRRQGDNTFCPAGTPPQTTDD